MTGTALRAVLAGPIRFFLFMSGVSPGEAYEQGEQRRYASIGALMTFMFGWYAVAMGHSLAATAGPNNLGVEIGFGLGWATLLTLIDRIVFGQPLMKDSLSYRFFHVFAIRGFIAVAGSLVTSIGALLFLFSHDVNAQLATDRQTTAIAILGPIQHSPDYLAAQAKIKTDSSRLAGLQNAVTAQQKVIATDEANIQCESAGTCGTHVPDDPNHVGPMTKLLMGTEATDKQTLDTATSTLKVQTPIIQTDIAAQNKIIQDLMNGGQHTINQDNGIQQRTDALRELIRHDWTMWLWIILIVSVDLCIVLFKTTLGASRVDLLHRSRAVEDALREQDYQHSPAQRANIERVNARRAEFQDMQDRLNHQRRMQDLQARSDRLATQASHGNNRGPSAARLRRTVTASVAAVVVAGAVTTWALIEGGGHGSNRTSSISSGPATRATPTASVKPVVPASFAAYTIPAPTKDQAAATKAYVTHDGQLLISLHRSVHRSVANYTPASCAALRKAVANPTGVLKAMAGVPDSTLADLGLDEVHDVVALPVCSVSVPAEISHLAGIDSLLTQRLTEDGVSA